MADYLQGERTKRPVPVPDGTQLNASEGLMASFLLGLIMSSSQQSEAFLAKNYAANLYLVAYIWAVIFKKS